MKHIAQVQEILRRWDPIGVDPGNCAPADEYHDYAPHIVSMVFQGCSIEDLSKHLGQVRVDEIGVQANPAQDREVAAAIVGALRQKAV